MALELWHVVVATCIAGGAVAWSGRYLIHLWGRRQLRRVNQEAEGLDRCWQILQDVPADVLAEPARQILARVMRRSVARVRSIQPRHALLIDHESRIDAFVAEPGHAGAVPGRLPGDHQRPSAAEALGLLEQWLADVRPGPDLTQKDLDACRKTLARKRAELAFLDQRPHANQADYLRRVTRALDGSGGLWDGQSAESRSALPTQ